MNIVSDKGVRLAFVIVISTFTGGQASPAPAEHIMVTFPFLTYVLHLPPLSLLSFSPWSACGLLKVAPLAAIVTTSVYLVSGKGIVIPINVGSEVSEQQNFPSAGRHPPPKGGAPLAPYTHRATAVSAVNVFLARNIAATVLSERFTGVFLLYWYRMLSSFITPSIGEEGKSSTRLTNTIPGLTWTWTWTWSSCSVETTDFRELSHHLSHVVIRVWRT